MAFNIVELAASVEGGEDTGFDQRCRFGHRVDGHAVYCHNDRWYDAPRKCRRSWYTNGRVNDEECAGFEVNPEFKGEILKIATPLTTCSQCSGVRHINADRGKIETCPLCMGSGEDPKPIDLTGYEQDMLESGAGHGGRKDTAGHPFVYIAKNDSEHRSIEKLLELKLVVMRSVTFTKSASAYLLENTMKGEAVMQANWKARKS